MERASLLIALRCSVVTRRPARGERRTGGDYSTESLAKANLLLLRIVIRDYEGPAQGPT